MRDIDLIVPIETFDQLDSTSRYARQLVESGSAGDHARLIVAANQTHGTGRFGRAWASPKGGLWCTLVWPCTLSPQRVIDGLGLRIGLAVTDVITRLLAHHGVGTPVRLKWPNDVMVGDKKVAGVLTEVIRHDNKTYILVGVGINVNFSADALPPDVQPIATTLRDAVGKDLHIERLTGDLRAELCEALNTEGLTHGTIKKANDVLWGVDREVTLTLAHGKEVRGVLRGLGEDGLPKMDTY